MINRCSVVFDKEIIYRVTDHVNDFDDDDDADGLCMNVHFAFIES